jgi:membrane-bound lytic murein transglycosylase B
MPLKTLARHWACLGMLLVATQAAAQASYATHPEARAFASQMASEHGLNPEAVLDTLAQVSQDSRVIRLITPPTRKGVRSWARYRGQFIEPNRINRGVDFWANNADELARASARYGVPPEIIVAIIGVETIYGRNTGHFTTAGALATLAFDYPPRAELFRRELENLFLLAREQGRDPLSYEGSYAGALGYPQFLPSSVRNYAVDFDGDGRIDLEASPSDAIGSVANYLAVHGWEPGGTVAIRAHVEDPQQVAELIEAGITPAFSADDFSQRQVLPLGDVPEGARAALIDLVTPDAPTEYWLGFRNFYVITRYNRSSFYAMAVFGLAEALQAAHTETMARAD